MGIKEDMGKEKGWGEIPQKGSKGQVKVDEGKIR